MTEEMTLKLNTSSYLLGKKELLKELVERLGRDFSYVSVLGTDVTGMTWRVQTSGMTLRPSNDEERGFVVRVFQESGFSEYSFNKLDAQTIGEVVRQVKRTAERDRAVFLNHAETLPYPSAPADEPLERSFVQEVESLPELADPAEVLKRMKAIHDRVKEKHEQLVQLMLMLTYTQVNKIFLSKNRDLYQSYVYTNAACAGVARGGDKVESDYAPASGLCGLELLDRMEELAEKAARQSVELLSAEKVQPGEYDIICDPEFTGLLAHEAFGHGTEMDMFVKDRAKGREYMNRRVGSDMLMMHDGATAAREVSSYLFDDEGNPGSDTLIIDHGILKSGMCDELSSLQLGVAPTGNGKRESYKRKAYTRMTNTFFDEGDDDLEAMIASIEHGYLLEGLSSGMEDPKNWGCQCVAAKGREIRDGRLTGRLISPVYLTGYVPELLESISMISPGLELCGCGYCGKGWKERVKTSTGGSYIKMRGRLS